MKTIFLSLFWSVGGRILSLHSITTSHGNLDVYMIHKCRKHNGSYQIYGKYVQWCNQKVKKTNNKDNKKNILFFFTLYSTCMVYYYPQTDLQPVDVYLIQG